MGRCQSNKNTCKLFAWVFSQKAFKMSTICTDTCLETPSPLVSCSVDNVSRHMSVLMVFKFPKVMQQHTWGVVGKLIWVLLDVCMQQRKNFANRSRIDTVIAMVTVAHVFDSWCIRSIPWALTISWLENAYSRPLFQRAILTRKVGQTS